MYPLASPRASSTRVAASTSVSTNCSAVAGPSVVSPLLLSVGLATAALVWPPATAAAADWTTRSAVGIDLGLGGVLTRYSPDAQDGGSVFFTSLRGDYDVAPDIAVAVLLRQWFLPGSNHATMPGLGVRFEPYQGPIGRAFVDAALGPTWTRDRLTFAYDLGGGFEVDFPTVAGLGIGPFLRYGQVIDPGGGSSRDGRAWSLGLSSTFHIGRWSKAAAAQRAGSPASGRVVRPFVFKVTDTDHDGVPDESDQCPEVAAGRHPDIFRPGCPENDEDADGVPDGDDICPTTAAGDHPDRARKGCPFIDSDGDGVGDMDDHCPYKPGPATNDPATNGCPVARKAAPQPNEEDRPREASPADLKPVSKRRLSGPMPSP